MTNPFLYIVLAIILAGIAAIIYLMQRFEKENKLSLKEKPPVTSSFEPSETRIDMGVGTGVKFGFGFGIGFALASILIGVLFASVFGAILVTISRSLF